ncbi:tRNA-Thr(GGU) m(6)t(6)A37 methyltransferase TsaA [Haloferula luteola]|uniref:tRNA-Thr(GGU) m(6)t(6)A37 methyltransferase TsaA n=1 Tax=Haloferula luteola TaxID=595692 RepID=A0A840UZJ5_9BACT|nr:tRNA (N6-threonylcarbamoyladenosine(37)-N6)-methyltransferase TrmO [Haloferula luteola]MBB5351192.1 tRNA-Thr(GGU) m(6)t(6)A37 methyltransferase TsaA [Haloferula luteola]
MTIEPVGWVRTCFEEKFGVPRQPGLCPSAWGELRFAPEFRSVDAVRGLEGFSHVWLVFGFHLTVEQGWRPTVRPPRLGGNERRGVFASRSTFRPNGLGLSLVTLEEVELGAEGPVLHLGGLDLVSGTPVYDVKPMIPFAEALVEVRGGYAEEVPMRMPVVGVEKLEGMRARDREVVVEALSLDPRPAAGRAEVGREFGVGMCGKNVKFRVEDGECQILGVEEWRGGGME